MSDARFGPEYPKINTVFKRNMEENGVIIPEQFSDDEFAYLADNEWTWTEKVDGTNIRLHFNGESITVGGRTDSAQIPGSLMFALAQFNNPALWDRVFADSTKVKPYEQDVTIYGEGYGPKIQSGARYRTEPAFIVFDIRVGRWWLKREDVIDAATNLGMSVVPIVAKCSLRRAIELMAAHSDGKIVHLDALQSKVSSVETFLMEGIVGTPSVPLFSRNGSRIIAKLKVQDFVALAKHEVRRAPVALTTQEIF